MSSVTADLVKVIFLRSLECVLYVPGHTKNACDWLFNQMKIRFHKDQVHSYRVALGILNNKINVTMIDTMEYMFKDYGKMFDIFNSNFENGTIHINPIFKVDKMDDSDLEMQRTTHEGSNVVKQSMLKRGATRKYMRLAKMKE
jgi:hypothetical protein